MPSTARLIAAQQRQHQDDQQLRDQQRDVGMAVERGQWHGRLMQVQE
jgi:hypothetical protein